MNLATLLAHLAAWAETYGGAARVYMDANDIDGGLYLLIGLTGLLIGWYSPVPTKDHLAGRVAFGVVFAEAVSLDSNVYRAARSANPHWAVQFWVMFSLTVVLCLAGAVGTLLARRYKECVTLVGVTHWVRRHRGRRGARPDLDALP